MSYQIITRITITSDPGVMVRMAANNIRPLDFRYDEVVSLTETLRTKGRPTLELELLSLFFKGLWQGRTRYDRAVGYTLLTDGIDKYEAWEAAAGTRSTNVACCCACGASCTTVPFRAAATSNIKEALCGVFMSDTSLFRGRGAASFRASSTRGLHWSQRAGIPESSKP